MGRFSFREISETKAVHSGILTVNNGIMAVNFHFHNRNGGCRMPSEKYLRYKKEFVNCLWMTPITLGFSLILAFTEWLPKMREEQRREQE